MRETPNVASRVTGTLGGLNINVLAVTEGSRSFTCVIPGPDTPRAVRGVHAAFNLSRQICSIMIIGAPAEGFNGSSTTAESLVDVISEQGPLLEKEQLRVVGAVGMGDHSHFNRHGIGLDKAATIVSSSRKASSGSTAADAADTSATNNTAGAAVANTNYTDDSILAMVQKLKDLPNPIIVDCSGSEEHEGLYAQCRSLAINVVVGNVKSVCNLSKKFWGFGTSERPANHIL